MNWLTVLLSITAMLQTLAAAAMTESDFGVMPDGQVVKQYQLSNVQGSQANILSYGAALRTLEVRTRSGKTIDIVLGYDTLQEYIDGRGHFGATVGRFANRIANAEFTQDGKSYRLTPNNGPHSLHGGPHGFSRVVWEKDVAVSGKGEKVRLKYVSVDGEEGFPGQVTVWVTYTLTDRNELQIDYEAITSATTIINLTNHSYFNLAGAGDGDVLAQRLLINASAYTPVGEDRIPTGRIESVQGTPMDFRTEVLLGQHLPTTRYDMNLVLNGSGGSLKYAAHLIEPRTGIDLRVYTTEPGLQLFTPVFTGSGIKGKNGKTYEGAAAVCLEPQHFPDSPHFVNFPSTVLKPGLVFHSKTVYRLSLTPLAQRPNG